MGNERKEGTKTSRKDISRNFSVGDCAFLRVVVDENGNERKTCLMRKGAECPNSEKYPYGEPCGDAVRREHINKGRRERYWQSMGKHHRVKSESKKGAFQGHSSKRAEYRFCKRKRRYHDQKTAEENRRWCEKQRGVPLRVLYCPFCKGWHLTHRHAKAPSFEDIGD